MTVKFRQVSVSHMKKILFVLVIGFVILTVFYCGKDKPPTGGPKDTTPPEIIDFEPGNLTTNFQDDEITITFTETIDERSFEDALHIYPPVMKKKITSGKQNITIKLKEQLKQDRTYLLTVDTRCKDLRDNSLEKVHSLIFSTSDSISAHKLNVNLELDERATERQGMYFVQLYNTQDTIFITSQNTEKLQNFTFDNLPSEEVSVIAFLDENKNSDVDKKRELFDEKIVKLDSPQNEIILTLALQDTTKPTLKKVVAESAQRLTISFSENIKKVRSIRIIDHVTKSRLPIYEYIITGSKIECITGVLDTNACLLELKDIADFNDNITALDTISFLNRQLPDTTSLELDSLSHEDGQTVTTLSPEFRIKFSKIIPLENVSILLVNSEDNQQVELNIQKEQGYTFVVKPKKLLKNYVPYSLIVSEETTDYEGNALMEGITISILPLLYK